MSVKYISDLHLYDIYSIGWRTNTTLEQFADKLEYNWNITTEEDDLVIIVGDIGDCCDKTKKLLRKLNGSKVLVLGNHDSSWGRDIFDSTLFQGVYKSINQDGIYVQHIPDVTVPCTYFIHGHHHRYDLPGMYNALKLYQNTSKMLNCSVDLTGHPMGLPELITNKELVIESYINRHLL